MTEVSVGVLAAVDPSEVVGVAVPAGGRVLVMSDLRLGALADADSEAVTTQVARRLDRWSGPGVVVLAGDTFELWAEPNNSPAKALRSHPRLRDALAQFARTEGRQVVVLAGNHDSALAWDSTLAAELREQVGATVGRACDLVISTGAGVERIRVEHGDQLDLKHRIDDPSIGGQRPPTELAVTDALPALQRSRRDRPWLDDADRLVDVSEFPSYAASRVFYRRLVNWLRWLAVPLMAVAALGLAAQIAGGRVARFGRVAPLLGLGVVAGVALVAAGMAFAAYRTTCAWSRVALGPAHDRSQPTALNDAARRRAVQLRADGYRGFISGHTHQAELTDLDSVFYANCGGNTVALARRPGRAWFPDAFVAIRPISWLEVEAGAAAHATLFAAQTPTAPLPLFERLASRSSLLVAPNAEPVAVATLTRHATWPPARHTNPGRRSRRVAASLLVVAGCVDLISTLTPPLRGRLGELLGLVPLAAPEAASFIAAASGVGLVLLAGGVRRGQRRAWAVALAVLIASAAANLLKGLDIEEALVSVVAIGYLAGRRKYFGAGIDHRASRRAAVVLAGTALLGVAAALAISVAGHVPFLDVATGLFRRVAGLSPRPVPAGVRLASAAVTSLLVVGAGGTLWLLLRARRLLPAATTEGDQRAWSLVERHGCGTLDYFALRDDKARYVWGDTVVAYTVRGGVALVSPDPIGPADERAGAWEAFRLHAADNGWTVAVVGAGDEWLPTYRAAGLTVLYAGDEAVVDVGTFSLEGGRNKTLRQAFNRVRKAGYTVGFHDPANLDPQLAHDLAAMMSQSRRGDVERGFSMTLSRLFDPRDRGLLLAVASGPDGKPAAFCQYVPAGPGCFSLDLMRRTTGEHPNGLTDFVVISTIEHVRALGGLRVGLNFATLRGVLAGETGDSLWQQAQRMVLRRLGQDMQIESLWRFNAKYDPVWVPRYVAVDGCERFAAVVIAIASVESLWELPLVGRILRPRRTPRGEVGSAAPRRGSVADLVSR